MIWSSQAIKASFFCKDILHESWIKVVLCLEYFCQKQLQRTLQSKVKFSKVK